MAVREILKLGNPILKNISNEVENIDKDIIKLIRDLKDTLYSTTGIGLAAPQIGVNKRVILIDFRNGEDSILLINPVIKRKLGSQESEEGCLSYPGYYGLLDRPRLVIAKGIDEKGQEVRYRADGLLCITLCHEIDHLNGIMFTDKAYELYEEEEE